MNWGMRILILYLSFVGLVVSMVMMSMREKVDLVTKNYYEMEIAYQDRINSSQRAGQLNEPLQWRLNGSTVNLRFPAQLRGRPTSGSIYFFRPSDEKMDRRIEIPADTSLERSFTVNGLERGLYKMEVSWETGDTSYFKEGFIRVN